MNTSTQYKVLRFHFDKLVNGGYNHKTGLEPIRDVYQNMFNKSINLFEVIETDFTAYDYDITLNPVKGIVTLIGPEKYHDHKYSEIFVPYKDGMYYCHMISSDIFTDIANGKASKKYISQVYRVIRDITRKDAFYGEDTSPYSTLLNFLPVHLTFCHITDFDISDRKDTWYQLIELCMCKEFKAYINYCYNLTVISDQFSLSDVYSHLNRIKEKILAGLYESKINSKFKKINATFDYALITRIFLDVILEEKENVKKLYEKNNVPAPKEDEPEDE